MNVYLDTSTTDFVLILFDNHYHVIDYVLLTNQKKKVPLITTKFEEILYKNNLTVHSISNFFTNIGPGYFTGVRSSLVYFRTIALALNKDLYVTSSFDILKIQYPWVSHLYLDAQGSKVYKAHNHSFKKHHLFVNHPNLIKVEQQKQHTNVLNINFLDMIRNLSKYKNIFVPKKPMKIEAMYIKPPQLGGK
ncbi:tRNA (adenosine(37)-N6)-threonylcarbamoyltransferase complex dimerization subunit type 1 TsaB [Mycoplasma corogypsi]|uniref:tRNA (adenosine(37)-N6)-threonylcarbamoyltransferase complex dimerization subunit type 1 TsaB n=1 Tax=Mycoplasma corogypsi TaxID=2106 RepID=UPI003873B896